MFIIKLKGLKFISPKYSIGVLLIKDFLDSRFIELSKILYLVLSLFEKKSRVFSYSYIPLTKFPSFKESINIFFVFNLVIFFLL